MKAHLNGCRATMSWRDLARLYWEPLNEGRSYKYPSEWDKLWRNYQFSRKQENSRDKTS